ncbi:MAG: sulfatase, partial [Planctomycetes bacterium]|nr:sulfatase [Planctomycetota bacterium]
MSLPALLSACSGEAGGGGEGRLGSRVLPLERALAEDVPHVAVEGRESGTVTGRDLSPKARFLPEEGDSWRSNAPTRIGEVKPLGIDRCLHVGGRGLRSVSLFGEFSVETFNQVTVGYLCQMRSRLTVRLKRQGEVIAEAEPLLVRVSSEPQLLTASFLTLGAGAGDFDEIEMTLPGRAGPVGVLFVELSEVAVEEWLESRLVRGTHARVGDEVRPGYWLTQGHVLRGSLTPRAGEGVEVGYSVEPLTASPPEGALIELTLYAGGAALRSERYGLDEAREGWVDRVMWTEGFEGEEVEFQVRLVECGAAPVGVWVSAPVIVGAVPDPKLVLLVTSDTHRADHLNAAMSGVKVKTPTLDALAARGVLFESAQAVSCITLPSHVAMLTGVHSRDLGIVDNVTALNPSAQTLAETFQEQGYRTVAAVSALHLGHEVSGLGQGFERSSAPTFGTKTGEESVNVLFEWLGAFEGESVFAWLHLYDPHAPYEAPEFDRAYLEEARAVEGDGTPLNVREKRAMYRGEISYVDYQLSILLSHPRVEGGVVAFTADHGEVLGQHGIYFTHTEVYPDTLRVPLIMTWPGCPAGTRVKAPVTNVGVARSLLSAAGLAGVEFPGQDLLAFAEGEGEEEPLYAFSFGAQSASVTWRDRHLILHLKGHPIGAPAPLWVSQDCQVEFFDLSEDPGCERDLVEERFEEAAGYRRMLIDWMLAVEDRGWSGEQELDAELLRELADLGYTGPSDLGGEGWWDPDTGSEW